MAVPWRRPVREDARQPRRSSVSVRILGLMLTLMVGALVVAGALTFSLQLRGLTERVEGELVQEIQELQSLGDGDQDLGTPPYDDVEQLLLDFLSSNTTGEYEAMIALVDGALAYETLPIEGVDVDLAAPEVLALVAAREVPGETVFTTADVGGTELQLAIASVEIAGSPTSGTLAVAIDIGSQRAAVYRAMATYGAIALALSLLTGIAGWVVMRRLLRPLTDLRAATAQIDTGDLTTRVSVSDPDNDVAELAVNFNQMLDRLEEGFADQRQFLDDAAHELRTPLTIVRGNLEIMQTDDPEDVEQTRTLVLDETDRMERLVGDLLLLARRARPDFLHLDTVPLEELAEEAFARVRTLADRDWHLDTRVGPRDSVHADRHRLLQAVVQLSANAVRFSSTGDPVVLRVGWRAPDGQAREQLGIAEAASAPARSAPTGYAAPAALPEMLVLAVEDGGVGIEPDDLARIFERFGRVETPTTSSDGQGLGLGLTIVQAIAQAHGGGVTVESQVGRGSTFRVWIPARGQR